MDIQVHAQVHARVYVHCIVHVYVHIVYVYIMYCVCGYIILFVSCVLVRVCV